METVSIPLCCITISHSAIYECLLYLYEMAGSSLFHMFKHKPTNSVEQNPLEADSHVADQEIHCPLWNLMIHYCVHNSVPWDHVLKHLHPSHTLTP
jgi:hypothetical protein